MEEAGIVSVVCRARGRFRSNSGRCGCGPSAIITPAPIVHAWIGPAADPPCSATVPAGPCAAMGATRMSGAVTIIAAGATCMRAVCDKQRCGCDETESTSDGPGFHESLRVGAGVTPAGNTRRTHRGHVGSHAERPDHGWRRASTAPGTASTVHMGSGRYRRAGARDVNKVLSSPGSGSILARWLSARPI